MTYKDAWDVDINLGIDLYDTEMRVFSKLDRGFHALSFDGIAKPDAVVKFGLVKIEEDTIIDSKTSKGKADRYHMKPIFVTNPISDVQTYTPVDANYTTDYIYENEIPEYGVPYEYKVSLEKGAEKSTKDLRTDGFIKYKVQLGDNLATISSYYGVEMGLIKSDNNLTTNIVKEGDVLILRFKKDNPKVSKDVYTPPISTVNYEANYVDLGPQCSNGQCFGLDPVNMTIGNYYAEEQDFTVTDATEVPFKRFYNSVGPDISRPFGNGFSTMYESYLTYDKDNNIFVFLGDGKIYKIPYTGGSYQPKESDRIVFNQVGDHILIEQKFTNTTFEFDDFGMLVKITDDEENETHIHRDELFQTEKIVFGDKEILYTYNDKKLVEKVTLPSGKSVSYKYDANRNLIEFTDLKASTKKYNYDSNNFLVSHTNMDGVLITQNTYDATGRVLKQIDGNSNVSTMSYQADKTIVTKGDGSVDTYYFDSNYDILKIEQNGELATQNTFDSHRNILTKTNADGEVTKFTYANDLVTSVTYPDGLQELYTYDSAGNMLTKTDKEGNTTTYTYNSDNFITSSSDNKNQSVIKDYDTSGHIVKETDHLGFTKDFTYTGNMITSITSSNGLVESYSYDSNGNVTRESDNFGKNLSYVYNDSNEIIQKNYHDGTNEQWSYDKNGNVTQYKNRIGGITTSTYDLNNNEITVQTDGMIQTNTYDELNRLIKEVDAQGKTKSYTYDVRGNKISEVDEYGNTTSYEYDGNNNVLKTVDVRGNTEVKEYQNDLLLKQTDTFGLVTTFEYDSLGREIKTTNPNGTTVSKEYSGFNLIKQVDERNIETVYEYDTYHRVIKEITSYPEGLQSTTTKTYDNQGNVIEENADGAITKSVYDVYGRVIEKIDPLGASTKTIYDLDGKIIERIDPLGQSTKASYDAIGNEITVTDKNGNTSTKTYNQNSQLVSESDPLGFVTTYEYQANGLHTKTIDPYNNEYTNTYDAYGNIVKKEVLGKVIEENTYDSYGQKISTKTLDTNMSYEFDDYGRTIAETDEYSGLVKKTNYDEFGNVISIEDNLNKAEDYIYDVYNQKIETVDAYGRKEKITYNSGGQIIEKANFDGTKETSEYDVQGRLVKSVNGIGLVTENTYDSTGKIIEENTGGRITKKTYDLNGQLVSSIRESDQAETKSVYDAQGNVIEVTDPLGYTLKSSYDAKSQIIKIVDPNGNEIRKEYDALGNQVKEIDALGNVTQTKYNIFGQVEEEVDARGFTSKNTYNDKQQLVTSTDKNGNVTKYTYNKENRIEKEELPNGAILEHVYDIYGRKLRTVNENKKQTYYTYDELDQVVKEVFEDKITETTYDKFGNKISVSINGISQEKNTYNELNQLTEVMDANNNVTKHTYNEFGEIVSTEGKGTLSEMTYDANGLLVSTVENKKAKTEQEYNLLGKPTKITVNGIVEKEVKYDGVGNEVEVKEMGVLQEIVYDANNRPVEFLLPSNSNVDTIVTAHTITYDETGNVVSIKDVFGSEVSFSYDGKGNKVKETAKNGAVTQYEYDSMDNIVKVQNNDERFVEYIYNQSNELITKKTNNTFARYEYDVYGNKTKEDNEYGYETKYTYDIFGNQTSYTKPNGTKIKMDYDALGNMISKGTNRYEYDVRNNLVRSMNNEGDIFRLYDDLGRVITTIDTKDQKVSYEYNDKNQVVSKSYGDKKLTYTYDDFNNLTEVRDHDEIVAIYKYNHRNEEIELIQDGIKTVKTYDDMGRIISQITTDPIATRELVEIPKEDSIIYKAEYAYDANDNLVKEVIDGKENTYAYDIYDQLVESKKYIDGEEVSTKYKYDVFGNQTVVDSKDGVKTSNFNMKGQLAILLGEKYTSLYQYDKNGNISQIVQEDGRRDHYTYNEEGQLTKLVQGNFEYEYEYDAEGNRIGQLITDTKDYHYDKWYTYREQVAVTNEQIFFGTTTRLKEKVKFKEENGNACEVDKKVTPTTTYELSTTPYSYSEDVTTYSSVEKQGKEDVTYYKDPIKIDYILDREEEYTRVLQDSMNTYVFGKSLLKENEDEVVTGVNRSVVAKVNKDKVERITYSDYGSTNSDVSLGYNGEMKDQSGLIYLRARYYDPKTARFVQVDTNYDGEVDNVASQNKYIYTLGNPYKYVDRDGNIFIVPTIVITSMIIITFIAENPDLVAAIGIGAILAVEHLITGKDSILSLLGNALNSLVEAVPPLVSGFAAGMKASTVQQTQEHWAQESELDKAIKRHKSKYVTSYCSNDLTISKPKGLPADWDPGTFLDGIPEAFGIGGEFTAAMIEILSRYKERTSFDDRKDDHHIIPHGHMYVENTRKHVEPHMIINGVQYNTRTYPYNIASIRKNIHVYFNLKLYLDFVDYYFRRSFQYPNTELLNMRLGTVRLALEAISNSLPL